MAQTKAGRARRQERHNAAMVERAEADAERVRAWVAAYVEREGVGPTWREVQTAMGWPKQGARPALTAAIDHLIERGVLDHERYVERSLRPGALVSTTR